MAVDRLVVGIGRTPVLIGGRGGKTGRARSRAISTTLAGLARRFASTTRLGVSTPRSCQPPRFGSCWMKPLQRACSSSRALKTCASGARPKERYVCRHKWSLAPSWCLQTYARAEDPMVRTARMCLATVSWRSGLGRIARRHPWTPAPLKWNRESGRTARCGREFAALGPMRIAQWWYFSSCTSFSTRSRASGRDARGEAPSPRGGASWPSRACLSPRTLDDTWALQIVRRRNQMPEYRVLPY